MNLRAVLGSLQPAGSAGMKNISLVKGQIFSGKIMKLFPHDRALVQLGGLKIHAQLEAPLVAGRSYWLQVANAKGTPKLRVLQSNEGVQEKATSVSGLLASLELSSGKSREAVVQTFINEKLPLSREMIVKGADWLHTAENEQDALDVLKQMAARRLPLTRTVFETLLAGRDALPLHEQLGRLMSSLNGTSEKSPELQQLKRLLPELILKPSLSGTEMKEILQEVINRLGLSFEHDLAKVQNPSKDEQLEILKSRLSQIIYEENPGEVKRQARQLLAQMNSQQVHTLADIEKMIQPQLIRALARFGFSMEADSNVIQTQMMQLQGTLKPLLMQVIQQTQSGDVRQQAQQLLAHVTSQQLNTSGEFQTIIQLPVQSGSHFSEATLKWEGKKKKDGRFDADFCRVLFYLDLEHLQETVVDVNIQKRFVGIRIFNESHDLQALIDQFEPMIKERLEGNGYHLSSLKQAQGGVPGAEWSGGGTGTLSEVDFRV